MAEPWTMRTIEETFGRPVGIGDLSDTLRADLRSTQTFIPLDITQLRMSGHLIERVNGDTDPTRRAKFPAGSRFQAAFPPVPWPPDLNAGANVVVHLLVQCDSATDDCDIDVLAFENNTGTYAADTEMGGKTAALTSTDITEVTVTLAAADITGHPGFLNLILYPDSHTTDNLYVYQAGLEYTRALRTS